MPQVLRDLRFHSFSFICAYELQRTDSPQFHSRAFGPRPDRSADGICAASKTFLSRQSTLLLARTLRFGQLFAVTLKPKQKSRWSMTARKPKRFLSCSDNPAVLTFLAYNTDGRARIYSLRLTNTFRVVLQNGVELLPTTTVSATRELIRDESDENGRANQERLLYEEMEQSCIHQMVSRMTHISEEAVQKGMHELE